MEKSNLDDDKELRVRLLEALASSNETVETVLDHVKSERKQKMLRMFLWFVPFMFLIGYSFYQNAEKNNFNPEGGYVAEVRITGVIAKGKSASAAKINPALARAFEDKKAKGVIISIDSPGGSPSESMLIHDEIRKLQKDYDRPVTIMSEGSLTSGAYWIALAGEEINSLAVNMVGSIGVVMSSWDLSSLAQEYQVKKHVITAGENKRRSGLLRAPKKEDLEKYQSIVDQIHVEFKALVIERRGNKLKGEHNEIFSGDFWLGREALKLGLIDNITTPNKIKMEKYQTTHTLNYTAKPGIFESLNPLASAVFNQVFNVNEYGFSYQ